MKGCDYSFARPTIAQLQGLGIRFAGRYLTGAGKALTAQEAAQLHAAGIGIELLFEAAADDALGGARQGEIDGAAAKAAAEAIGAPAGVAIYFAVDFDTTDLVDVEAYARAFATAIAPRPVGVYGEGLVCHTLAALGAVGFTHQAAAAAWAGGLYPAATITQGGSALGGVVDLDVSATDDFGGWFPASTTNAVSEQEAPMGKGYVLLGADGGLFPFGDVAEVVNKAGNAVGKIAPGHVAVGVHFTATGQGYWIFASDGGVFAFGDAEFAGSMAGEHMNAAIVGADVAP